VDCGVANAAAYWEYCEGLYWGVAVAMGPN
jgi:hypothetical protein